MLTLADIQTPQFQQASGFCTTSPEFLELVNLAIGELIIRGDWPGTLLPIRVCVKNGCVTWPRYVDQVRKINTCHASAPVQNEWYQFMDHGHERGPVAWYNAWGWRGGCIDAGMAFQYRAPTYNDIYGPNCTLRVYPAVQQDAGATVTIFGTDNNNQPLMTDNGDGTWSEGIVITVPTITPSTPYGSSSVFISKIDRVVKSVTQGNLMLYAYDTVNNVLWDLAVYEPSETSPSYLRYQLSTGVPRVANCSTSNTCNQSIVALVKLANLPVKVGTDLVILDNRRALLNAIRALKSEEAGNISQAQGQWQVAIETLNRSLENASPDMQFSARNNVLGGRNFANQMF